MRAGILIKFAVLGSVALSLSACDSLRREAGLTKQTPDEFAVVTKAPLIIPPNFNLQPPAPGAPPLNQQEPTDAAQTAMFSGSAQQQQAALTGSPAERLLLTNARAQSSDPSIRAELQADNRASAAAADQSFTDRVLNGSVSAPAKKTAPLPEKKSSGGWFDWF